MADTESSWPATAQRLRLGEIEVDLRYRRVQRAGATQELNPRCFDLLLLFLREPKVVHARDEIFRKVWPGVIVEDASLSTSVWQLRRALGGEAKQWIRTVSKQGYIFDPPESVKLEVLPAESRGMPITAVDTTGATPEPASADLVVKPADTPSAPSTAATAAARRRTRLGGLLAALLATLVLAAIVVYRPSTAPAGRVELVAQLDPSLSAEARWPTELLQAWIEWQLRLQPGTELSTATDDLHGANALVLLLSVDMPAPGSDEWRIAARFHGPDAPVDIVQRASGDNLVTSLDEVTRAVLTALPSRIPITARPELAVNKVAAMRLVAGLLAERSQRWNDAIAAYQEVINESQSFGFARMRLARCQYELGQLGAAQVEMGRAQAWISGLPPTLRKPFEAQEALLRQNFAAAASAYAALQQQSATALYRVAEATALRRDGKVREAAERLNGDVPLAPSLAVPWLLERAAIEAANRDNVHGSASASAARDIAHELGWDHSYARATLQLAELQAASGKPVEAGLFEQARLAFERAGDKLGVLRATVSAELQASADAEPAHLDELLAEASQAGNATVELDALRRTAAFHIRHGELQRAHERYAQAAAVAQATGSAIEKRDIDLLLVQEDFLRLDFAAMDQRIARLRAEPMQGRIAFIVGLNAARLHHLRGDYVAALEEHERTVAALNAANDKNLSPFATVMVCQRATVATQQGRTAAARVDFRECRAIGEPSIVRFADLGEAELAIDTGDFAEARRLLAPMHDWLEHAENQQDRWSLSNGVTALLAPLGDFDEARKIIDEALPGASRAGYRLIEANLRDTLAQMALARGRLDEAEREANAVEALLPPQDWYEQRRVRSVRVGIAVARGQRDAATKLLASLHDDARKHGDVLGELQAHGLADTAGLTIDHCTSERRNELLAQSGMRGANDGWILPATSRVKNPAP